MSERYTKLFALTENLYTEGAPVVIAAGSLLKDNQTGKILAQIKYKNISSKIIKAVKVAVRAFDVSGTEIEGIQEYQYLDLSAARDAEFGQKNAIALPDKVTRSFSCECKSIIFSDGTTWEEKGAEWKPLIQPETLQKRLGGLSAQYQRETIRNARFVVTDDRDLWICTCGAINRQSEAKCHACHSEKTALFAALDMEALKEHNAAYNKRESERREKETAEAAKKKAKTKKISMIAAACAVVVIAAIVVITQVIVPSSKYNSAVALMNEGKYQQAITAFEELDEYKDSITLLEKCEILLEEQELQAEKEEQYQQAKTLLNSEDSSEAYYILEELGDYKDSAEYLNDFTWVIDEESYSDYLRRADYSYRYNYGSNGKLMRKKLVSWGQDYPYEDEETLYQYREDGTLLRTERTYYIYEANYIDITNYDEYQNPVKESRYFLSEGQMEQDLVQETTSEYTYYPSGKIKTCKSIITQIEFQTNEKNIEVHNYSYNEDGSYTLIIENNNGLKYKEIKGDIHGNVISEVRYDETGTISDFSEWGIEYDDEGNMIFSEATGRYYEYDYDDQGRLDRITIENSEDDLVGSFNFYYMPIYIK